MSGLFLLHFFYSNFFFIKKSLPTIFIGFPSLDEFRLSSTEPRLKGFKLY